MQTVALVTVTLRVSINHDAKVDPWQLFNALEVTKATINDEAVDDVQTVEVNDVDIV